MVSTQSTWGVEVATKVESAMGRFLLVNVGLLFSAVCACLGRPQEPAAATVAAPVAPVAATTGHQQVMPALAHLQLLLRLLCSTASAPTLLPLLLLLLLLLEKLLLQPLLSLLLRQLLNNFQRLRYVFSIKYFSYPYLISTLRQKL